MNGLVKDAIEKYKEELKKIIKLEKRLRNPPITVVFCPEKYIREIYIQFISMLKQLRREHPSWNYVLINTEKILFDILKEFGYIEGDKFARECAREDLAKDLKEEVKKDFINIIQKEINVLVESSVFNSPPPFLILLNIHSCYPYIQTGDLIAQIHGLKNKVLVLILYLQKEKEPKSQKEIFKEANYNVNTYYLFENY